MNTDIRNEDSVFMRRQAILTKHSPISNSKGFDFGNVVFIAGPFTALQLDSKTFV